VTTWAAAGEFVTIAKLFSDIGRGGSLPGSVLVTFIVLVAVAAAALILLIWRRSRAILTAQSDTAKADAHKKIKHDTLAATGVTGLPGVDDGFVPELDSWPAF